MPASQIFSGNGNPNGIVDGNPGDLYQDQAAAVWLNTVAPSTWVQLSAVGGGGDFALAFIGNSEGPTIISQVNVSTVSFDGTVTTLTLTTPVPDPNKAILTVTLFAPSNGPNGVFASMPDASTVEVGIQDVAANPTFSAFYFRLALVP
jgi:hypothetical protein